MQKNEETAHAILIVSASDRFDAFVRRSLTGFITVDSARSAATARRLILERFYDMIAINAPLPDENATELAGDSADGGSASVILAAPQDSYEDALERLTDHGVLILPKPFSAGQLDKAIRFLIAIQNKMRSLRKKALLAEEKNQELRVIDRAKLLLIERKHMTEDEAHRLIGKKAMDGGMSRKRAAMELLEDLEE